MLSTRRVAGARGARYPFPSPTDINLLCREEGPCLSIFLGPYVAGSRSRHSGVELETAMPGIAAALHDAGVHAQDAEVLLEPLWALIRDAALSISHRESLCLYRSPGSMHCFSVRTAVETGWHLEDRFLVAPILAELDARRHFLLLELTNNRIRLFRCANTVVELLALPEGVPASVAEFIGGERGVPHASNHAFGVRFGTSEGREDGAHFRHDFMTAVDRGLLPYLRKLGLPLVLAGVDEETSAYAAVSGYADIVADTVRLGVGASATAEQLSAAGERAIRHWTGAPEREALAAYGEAPPEQRTQRLEEILDAASSGAVRHLFLERGAFLEGKVGRMTPLVSRLGHRFPNADLLNAAAADVLLHKGAVWLIEPERMPVASVSAAVLRYAGGNTGRN